MPTFYKRFSNYITFEIRQTQQVVLDYTFVFLPDEQWHILSIVQKVTLIL